MIQHYVLSDEDLTNTYRRLNAHNRLGFALQLCAFRYPGRYLRKGEVIPAPMLSFVANQLGVEEDVIVDYAFRPETRNNHINTLRETYGYQPYSKVDKSKCWAWLLEAAIQTNNSLELVEIFVKECCHRKIILPGISMIERLCADAKVAVERSITKHISSNIDSRMKKRLYAMLEETIDGRVTVYAWLRRFEIGNNSADSNKLMERLEYLKELGVPDSLLDDIPKHRIIWLRQQGEAYYADGLRDIKEERRLSILAVCAVEWKAMVTDSLLDTHDRIVGRLNSECSRIRDDKLLGQKKMAKDTLKSFIHLSQKLLKAHGTNTRLSDIVGDKETLEALITTATELTTSMTSDPLDFVLSGYGRFRRYTQRMLENITFEGNEAAQPLLQAIEMLKEINQHGAAKLKNLSKQFATKKWSSRMGKNPERKLWETAILFTIRDSLRSRDIWISDSHKYQDTRTQLLPINQAQKVLSLSIPLNGKDWVKQRRIMLEIEMKKVSSMIREGKLPRNTLDNGILRVDRLKRDIPDGVDDLTLKIYQQLPQISITDILKEVDKDSGFTDAFTHLQTSSSCPDKLGLLNVILSGGLNLGLKKMALCSSSHKSFWTLMRLSQWYINKETMQNALSIIMDAQNLLPAAKIWGDGTSSSSDGQFFPAGGTGEAMNVVNARYGHTPGIKAYTHVSNQYALFAIQTIPATVHEAPYIIDGLTMNDTGKNIKEHYADTGGFTDHVFALCSLLGYEFAPRLRNLSTLNLYGIEGVNVPQLLKELITVKANINRIEKQWPEVTRLVASIMTHRVIPSDILRQLASFPRQNELAIALKEIGKIERTIFILKWVSSTKLQRRAQLGLNKGEAHHALKRALNFNRRGEIRDRTSENQHLRMMSLNLLASIIIYWNTKHIGRIIHSMRQQGCILPSEKLVHLSPLGWEHIIITGFYEW